MGSDLTVARRFELLANHWVENTIEIVFQIRLQLVTASAISFHPLQVAKCHKKMTLPTGKETKTSLDVLVTGLCVRALKYAWLNCILKSVTAVLFKIKRKKKINEAKG